MTEQDLGYRRIQRTGRDSYIISLPKEWMLSVGLEKGDQLAFKRQEDLSLLLVPRKVLEKGRETKGSAKNEYVVRIDSKDDPQSISRRIISLYAVGADLIHVRFREREITPEQRASIKKTAIMLLGSEIIEESSEEIKIQILIGQSEFPIEKAISRMFVIAKTMDREAVSSLKSLDEDQIRSVIDSDNDLNRLNLYVIRQLKYGVERNLFKEMGFKSSKEFLGYRVVTKNIENIGDNAISMAKNVLILKKLIADQVLSLKTMHDEVYSSILEVNSFAHRLFDDSLKALFKRDYNLADRTISLFMSKGIRLERDAVYLILSKKIDPNLAYVLRLILDNSRKMMEYSRDIAEVTLNRTVEEISV